MQLIKRNLRSILPFVGLILVVAVLAILSGGRIFSKGNLNNILDQSYTIVLLSIGCSFLYAHGGFDLAVGGIYGLSMMVSGLMLLGTGMSPWIVLPMCIVISVVCYMLMGLVTIKLNLPAFITSLCMQFICRGIVTTISSGNISLPKEMSVADNWVIKIIVLVVVIVASYLLMTKTPFGKRNRAIGENPVAARQSGIEIDKTRIIAYLICAVLVALAGFFSMASSRTVATLSGSGYEMDVIVAVVLGGMSLNGGMNSSVRAPIIGALIVVLLTNGLVIIGIPSKWSDFVIGIVFLIVILFTYKRNRKGLLAR
ncbi:MAG: ABC transporter permease [Parasporobacterium sp.]|nr:ABC transporter permease [Parasporobacterium sp.]